MTKQLQLQDEDPILIAVAICYTLFTLLFQLISELWHSSPEQLRNRRRSLATNLSPKMKVQHNTQPMSTTKTLLKVPSHAPVTSTRTRGASSVATGFQPVARTVTTPRRNSDELTGWYDVPDPRRHRRIHLRLRAAQLLQEMR
jgi:hypothetical protein